ncbi:hypothetical protein BYT27DRAFT_7189632 [Phlegmacium glaucopus]|nr:hypothetical protein BYT27DRAFT_7189632 [Phlegmacium glaucopus]
MLLKQIFLENGAPIAMHIHPSIANVNARSALGSRIMHSGGDPHASAQSARVILADPNTDVFQHLIKTYQGVADKYIESYLWVKKCIEKGTVVYTPLVYKNPGGRRPGEERTQFTEQDENNLCDWIAAKIPYKETGGRTGNRLYQQLCDLSGDPEYAWVSRHTWQSWRERYKKNAERLDNIIASIVEQKKPAPGEKGQYGYVRQAEEKPKRTRKKRVKAAEQPGEFPPDASVMAILPSGSSSLQMGPPLLRGPEHHYAMASLQNIAVGAYPTILPAPSAMPLDRSTVRKTPDEEEMEDAEESSEWAVRVGDAPPPAWGKRKASDDDETDVNKRARFHQHSTPTSRVANINAMNDPTTNLHVIDQGIREIARDFRFTVEEVQEYYDRCGEMTLTHLRFQRMREELQAKFRDDLR